MYLQTPLLLLALVSNAAAYWRGINIKDNLADGVTCKTQSDWTTAFNLMKNLPGTKYGSFNSARLYAAYECRTLQNAVPAALNTNTKLLVGIDPELNYAQEKGALLDAVNKHGWSWIAAISVGSEDIYRGQTDAVSITSKVKDVRGMLASIPGYTTAIKIGHVDTNDIWFDTSAPTLALIRACDFIGADIYPYFQTTANNSVENAPVLFDAGIAQLKTAIAKAGSKATIWVTETGWPINGPTEGLAVANIANAKKYYKEVGCGAFASLNTWWFTLQDWNAKPSFAVVNSASTAFFDLSC